MANTPQGALTVYMMGGGGSNGASYYEPPKTLEPEIVHPPKYLTSKFPIPKNIRLKNKITN